MGRNPNLINPDTIKTLDAAYTFYCKTKSDCYEHLPIYLEYGKKVKHITEFGVRTGRSTIAWLMAKPKTLICCDLKIHKNLLIDLYKKWAKESEINFNFIINDSLQINIEPTDLLFLDTIHTYTQVKQELELHHEKVRNYILLHDTVTYGKVGMDNKKPGLIQAISEFITLNYSWEIDKVYTNNNGLTILKRII